MDEAALRESLSALVDGELTRSQAERVLDAVVRDPGLREQWRRHHLIGAVLSGQAAVPTYAQDVAGRVAAALAVDAAPKGPRYPPRYRRAWLPGALAASLAVLAVVAGLHLTDERRDTDTLSPEHARAAVPDEATAGTGGAQPTAPPLAARSSTDVVQRTERTRMTWNDTRPAVEARLNAYLLNHNEYLAGGVRGMLPYARVVGYDARD